MELNVERGVPETTPVVVFRDKPAGRVGVIENVLVPGTSVTVNAVVGVIAAPASPVTVCDDGVMEGAASSGDDATGAMATNTDAPTTAANVRRVLDHVLCIHRFPSTICVKVNC